MPSDSDILEQLDDILAKEESGDEFLDELYIDDDSDRSPSPPISPSKDEDQLFDSDEQGTSNTRKIPVVQNVIPIATPAARRKNVHLNNNIPLHTPNFKWKFTGNFRPKIYNFDSSKSGVQKHEFGLNDNSPILKFFETFMSEFILGKVAFETNRYAEDYLKNENLAPKSRVKFWKPTNIEELYIFLATNMLMTQNKKLEINDY